MNAISKTDIREIKSALAARYTADKKLQALAEKHQLTPVSDLLQVAESLLAHAITTLSPAEN
jgi:hypothetical protein